MVRDHVETVPKARGEKIRRKINILYVSFSMDRLIIIWELKNLRIEELVCSSHLLLFSPSRPSCPPSSDF